MDFKQIKGVKHYLYEKEEFFNKYPQYRGKDIPNWKQGKNGDWVYTDDNDICQVLKRGSMKGSSGKSREYVRTVCGSHLISPNNEMIGEIAENIYAFSKTNEYKRFIKKEDCTSREQLFARYVASGKDVVKSYLDVYDTKNVKYARTRANKLLKQDRVNKMVKEEIQKVLDEEEVTPSYIIARYKVICDAAENETHQLKALDSLAKISGMFEQEQEKKETLTVWGGPSVEQIESLKDEKIIAHAERETIEENQGDTKDSEG